MNTIKTLIVFLFFTLLLPAFAGAEVKIDMRTNRDMMPHTNVLMLTILADKPQKVAAFIIMKTSEGAINHDYVVGTISKGHPMHVAKMEFGNDEYMVFAYDLETKKLLGTASTSDEMEKIAVEKFAKDNPQFVGVLQSTIKRVMEENQRKAKNGLR